MLTKGVVKKASIVFYYNDEPILKVDPDGDILWEGESLSYEDGICIKEAEAYASIFTEAAKLAKERRGES